MIDQSTTSSSWCTIGDFNMITSAKEKLGGIPYTMSKSFDFISIIKALDSRILNLVGKNSHSLT